MTKLFHLSGHLITLLFVFTGFAFSQEMATKQIPQVTIIESNKKYFSDDHTTQTIDLKSFGPEKHQTIGYILERQSPALIRTYGSTGALASISLHGTGSNHTQVSWNGFPLNSPTTGQIDLSLIPSGFVQSVEVINGASGALFGSGTFGGSINLNNEPDWRNRISLLYSTDAGSFGSFGHMFSVRTGNERFQYQLSAIASKAANDFTFRDHYQYRSPERVNEHGAYKSLGIVQNMYLKLNNGNYIEGGFWFQHKSLEIPALMGAYKTSRAEQKDSLFRSFLSYRKTTSKSALVIKSAYFSDHINYTDKINESDSVNVLDSKISTGRLMSEAEYRHYLSAKVILGGGGSFNFITGNSNNYGGRIRENEYALYGNIKIISGSFILNAGLRKEFYKGLNPELQYSFGIRYKANERFMLRTGFSSKFRKPSFNEKYWKPGGNAMLRPEKGRGGEVTADWTVLGSRKGDFWLNTRITGYYQWIDNWIQWVVRDSLTPVEYKKVHASGLETWVEYGVNTGMLKIKGYFNYNLNRSLIISTYDDNELFERNQLMYVPRYTYRTGCDVRNRLFMAGLSVTYTGMRETVETADESLRLPAFTIVDLVAGLHMDVRNINMTLNFRIDNLLDQFYEVIRSYPTPGRMYHITLTIGFDKTSPEN